MQTDAVKATPAGSLRMGELLETFAFASDLALGLPAGHVAGSCYIAMHVAKELGLPADQHVAIYYTALLKDAGCTCWTGPLADFWQADEITARREILIYGDPQDFRWLLRWLLRYVGAGAPLHVRAGRFADFFRQGPVFMREGFETACRIAARIAERLGMPATVQEALLAIFEQWSGTGQPGRVRGTEIPLVARVVFPTTFLEAFHGAAGRDAAREVARRQRGRAFDPAIVDAFLAVAESDDFWQGLENTGRGADVLALEPESPYRYVGRERVDDLALAFADFADLKTSHLAGHSRRIAEVAEAIARGLDLPDSEVGPIRRAALTHDIGLVTVPSFILGKPQKELAPAEWEQVRLHPYHSERILRRVPVLATEAAMNACHHERLDGGGYYRGIPGDQIPVGARILAVADRFDDLIHDTPGVPALDPASAAKALASLAGNELWPEAVESLQRHVGVIEGRRERQRPDWPAGLTDREVEVLRLAATGMTRRDIARALFVSESTVRHHLEHVYSKTGASTRVEAILFAMERGLLL